MIGEEYDFLGVLQRIGEISGGEFVWRQAEVRWQKAIDARSFAPNISVTFRMKIWTGTKDATTIETLVEYQAASVRCHEDTVSFAALATEAAAIVTRVESFLRDIPPWTRDAITASFERWENRPED